MTFAPRSFRRIIAAAAIGTLLGPLAPVASSAAPAEDASVIEGEMLVRFRAGASASEKAAARARNGLNKVRNLPVDGVELVRFDGGDHPSAKAQRMRLESAIEWAEPNRLWTTDEATTPSDPYFSYQWALQNTGAYGTSGVDIGYLDAAPAMAERTDQVVVAVVDTGTDISHPDLAGQIWVNIAEKDGRPDEDDDGNGYIDDVNGWDWWNGNASVFDEPVDDDHGTHVAGTISATTGNAIGVTGVSDAQIMPLKFIGPEHGSTAAAVQALDYAMRNGADIVNASWGAGSYDSTLAAKIAELERAGVLVVASAGNGGTDHVGDDNDVAKSYPASYPSANVVSVAATDEHDRLAGFSNYGATQVDLGAPGVGILSTLPGNELGYASGTSMAAPHVSGALAHMLAKHPDVDPLQTKDLLLSRTQPLPALEGKTVTGGRLDLAYALGADLPTPSLRIVSGDGTIGEADDYAYFTVSMSGPHPEPISFTWSSGAESDTATPDDDYLPVVDELVTVEAGAVNAHTFMWLNDDDEIEPDETVTATVTGATGATIAAATATTTVTSDDVPTISVAGPSSQVAEGDGSARFTVTLNAGSADPAEISYTTVDGTATAGADYATTSGTIPLEAGVPAHIDVPILDDDVHESVESFDLVLSQPTGAALGVATASATIADDDAAPVVGGGGTTSGGGADSTAPATGGGGGGGSTAPPAGGGGGGGGGTAPTSAGDPVSGSSDPDGATPTAANPLVVAVRGPAGPITVTENAGAPVAGHAGLGRGVKVEAPEAPADDPLQLSFDVHVPRDVPADQVVAVRNGVAVSARCTAPGVASPSPCEASRSRTGDVLRITVLSTHASQWDLAVPSVLRLAGADRISTAVAVSNATWASGQAGSVVLARADNYPDALAGGALAAAIDAPLLLTGSGALSPVVVAELQRVLPRGGTVRLLGGAAALSPAIDAQLAALGYRIERLAGADRFATAVAIAQRTTATPTSVLVTTGTDFPDALAASAAAGHTGAVVVLTAGRRLPDATATYLAGLGDVPLYAVGGPAAAALEAASVPATPLAGTDRYATSALVAERFFDASTLLGIATGESFPDALAAGARLGRAGAPLVLSPRSGLTAPVAALAGSATRVELYGGAGALSADVERQARNALG